MKHIRIRAGSRHGLAFLTALGSTCAWATNGAQLGGYGIENAMMGGTSIALPLDTVAAANNPAGMAYVPNMTDIGVQLFHGQSSADYVLPGNTLHNDTTLPAPEGGVNWAWGNDKTFGITVAGLGVSADYQHAALPVPGAENAKSSLRAVDVIPSVTWRPRPDVALGVGLDLSYEQFHAQGVIVPAPVPGGLMPLPDHGTQSATGASVRLGVLWQVSDQFHVGAAYKSLARMSALSGYKDDLLAYSSGRIDIPAQYGLGIAYTPIASVTLAADWLDVQWHGVRLMQDPNGFNWRNQNIYRAGVAWDVNAAWTLRAGFSTSDEQVPTDHLAANLLTPSINHRAYTTGVSVRIDPKSKLSFGYELDPRITLQGTGSSQSVSLTSKIQLLMAGYQRAF